MIIGGKVFIRIVVEMSLGEGSGRPVIIWVDRHWSVDCVYGRYLFGILLIVVVSISKTTFEIVVEIRLGMVREISVKVMLLDGGGSFVLDLKGFNVEN